MRRATMELAESLDVEDWVPQSMPDASPVKWHLAHTTWFFDRFVLQPLGVEAVDERYDYLFNSYYDAVGKRHARHQRGLLTRPSARDVVAYRTAVDARLADLGHRADAAALELGLHHEQQHQELLLTDVKHLFAQNPLRPSFRSLAAPSGKAPPLAWHAHPGGLVEIGAAEGFAFDNERPRHRVYLAPFALASRLVTCGEYRAFIAEGGYRRPELWLAEGWAWAQGREAPLYWEGEHLFTLGGLRAIADDEPVCHVTYYEADAYARWAGARLPREAEWEACAPRGGRGAFAALHPTVAGEGLAQMFGDAWEWTQSAYEAYPGFAPLEGAFGEYNGKFMVSQMVLRGGSCVTPDDHVRASYRNFFPPAAAWQFSGIRLARDAT